MAARTLEQILSELGSTYDPQVAAIRTRQGEIPTQIAAEEQGLQARQSQAFGDITDAARRRGLGFSGIPLSEQAKYTSTEFLPSLSRLRQSGREQAMSLEDAILGINERRNTMAQQLQQGDYQRDFEERQFAEQQRQFNEQLAASRRAASGSGASLAALFGGANPQAAARPGAPQAPQVSPEDQADAEYVGKLLGSGLNLDQRFAIVNSLKSSKSDQAKRRFNLGVQLGYWADNGRILK